MSANGRPRVIVAEPDYLMREGLRALLRDCPSLELVDCCGGCALLRAAVREHEPDVVLSEAVFPGRRSEAGIELLCELAEANPELGLVLLTATADPSWAEMLLAGGLDGRAYILKDRVSSRDELISTIEAVAAGKSIVDSEVVLALVSARREAEFSPLSELTAREREVLAHMANGDSNEAIAQALVLTKRAVEKHIHAVFMKLRLARGNGIDPRTKAVVMFLATSNSSTSRAAPRPATRNSPA